MLRIDSDSSSDFIEVEIVSNSSILSNFSMLFIDSWLQVGGCLFVSYNLGTQDITIGNKNVRINDGSYHVLRFTRIGANATLQIDDFRPQITEPPGRQLLVFNTQNQIQFGGKWNQHLNKVDRPFIGVMAGLVFNNLRPLDLASESNQLTRVQGNVRLLNSIPFNYRERHPRLFDLSLSSKKSSLYQMQNTNPSVLPEPGVNDDLIVFGRAKCDTDDDRYYDPQCYAYEGSGDDLITPLYNPPIRPKWDEPEDTELCDDDEDCGRDSGSGMYFEGLYWAEGFVAQSRNLL